MTKEQLEEYRSKKEEIEELRYKLEHLGEGDSMVGNDIINDYRSGYPVPQAVIGVDTARYKRLEQLYKKRIEKLERECAEVEEYVENIEDSMTRRIFRMYYIDGITLEQIGMKVHLNKSNVSRKIDNFLKIATHATNATL